LCRPPPLSHVFYTVIEGERWNGKRFAKKWKLQKRMDSLGKGEWELIWRETMKRDVNFELKDVVLKKAEVLGAGTVYIWTKYR
jgi:hypothetical protein